MILLAEERLSIIASAEFLFVYHLLTDQLLWVALTTKNSKLYNVYKSQNLSSE